MADSSRSQNLSTPAAAIESNDLSQTPTSSHKDETSDVNDAVSSENGPTPSINVHGGPYHTAAEIRARRIAVTHYQLAKLWLEDFEATSREQCDGQAYSAYEISHEEGNAVPRLANPHVNDLQTATEPGPVRGSSGNSKATANADARAATMS